ncbi:MAG: sugar transferase [Acidobacteriaceae bacterium]|nr:sugar transferase [Acidobacteriaceae bacterium]
MVHSEIVQVTGAQLLNASPWCLSQRKRAFDLLCAALLLLAASPVMVITALAVKLCSPGPVFFRQIRTGKDGINFEILKFRTMTCNDNDDGPRLTQRGDRRVTPISRVIRRCKLDELPQLWNVVRGDMSLVGPRPDLPEYLANLNPKQMQVLQLRPGITSPASLKFRDEEDFLAKVSSEDLPLYYVKVILPEKVGSELEYARCATFSSDFKVLYRTALAVLPSYRSGAN